MNPSFLKTARIASELNLEQPWVVRLLALDKARKHWTAQPDGTMPLAPIEGAEVEFEVWQGSAAEQQRRAAKRKIARVRGERRARAPGRSAGRARARVAGRGTARKADREVAEDDGAGIGSDLSEQSFDAVADIAARLYGVGQDEAMSENNDQELDDLDIDLLGSDEVEKLFAAPQDALEQEPPDEDDAEAEAAEAAEAIAAEPAPMRAPRAGGVRETEGILELLLEGGGIIRYNPRTKNMQAFCPFRDTSHHPDCRRTRTVAPKSDRASGRPLGPLGAWILQHHQHDNKLSHVHWCEPSFSERQAARRHLATLDGWADMAKHEKDADQGFDREPDWA